jgi:transposase
VSKEQDTIYVGMDVHKKSINVAVVVKNKREPEAEWQVENTEKSIKQLIKKLSGMTSGSVKIAYEAGPCGYVLQRRLCKEGFDCIVVAPSLIPVKPGERVKTDKRDARKLAEMLKADLLTEVHAPSTDDEAVRDLTRAREDTKEDQMSARHRILKMLLRHGFTYHDGKHWTQKHRRWLKQIKMENKIAQDVFDGYLLVVEQIEERLKSLNEQIENVAKSEKYREQAGWLRCLRGVDTVTAMMILAELHDFRRFTHPRELMSFLGLTPSEYSSSDRVRRGSITKAGNSHVRRVLMEAAWHYRHKPSVSGEIKKRREGQPAEVIAIADRAQARLHRRYFRLKEGYNKPSNVVIVAIARELAGFIWAVLHCQKKA